MKPGSPRHRTFHYAVFFFLLLGNIWIFLNRNDGYAYTESFNYEQLYEGHSGLQRWEHLSPYTTEEEKNIGRKILTDSAGINSSDSSLVKVRKIAAYLLSVLDERRGQPADLMQNISPMQEFNYARTQRSEVWCGNFADIFSFFANLSGVPTRYVAEEGDKENQHVFNECFIKELGQWVFVDLTSKIISARDHSGKHMNAIQLYRAHLAGSGPVHVLLYEHDTVCNRDYASVQSFYEHYFDHNSLFVFYYQDQFNQDLYSVASKLKRYISKAPTFACYRAGAPTLNVKFYIKVIFFYLLVIFMVYRIGLSVRRYIGKRERK